MRKNLLKNSGFPYSVDVASWLKPIKNSCTDSWYVKAEFQVEGQQYGFTWHEGTTLMPDPQDPSKQVTIISAESLFMDVEKDLFISNEITALPDEKNGVDPDCMRVYSKWGELSGDEKKMRLDLVIDDNEVHVDLEFNNEVMLNGGIGLIEFGSESSYEYAFPNMKMEGTVKIQGREFKIENAYAWFDRQVGLINQKDEPRLLEAGRSCWMWIGMPRLNGDRGAISLWDVYNPGRRNAFATVIHEDGTERNVNCDITYDNIWTSETTGFSYPRTVNVDMPEEDIHFTMTCMSGGTNQEFVREPKGLSGCQCLYRTVGSYKGIPIDRAANVEMIGDLCGEV
ncbi:MAG: carotenoid 1,2-hydratase [Lachnospiraceae bacterium]|nr:carotenoid 1,2-hydratase [Lachnospiraceae bacterium]